MELRQVAVFTVAECQLIAEQVHDLRQYWIARREPPCFFFTLGAAAYLDCPAGQSDHKYHESAKEQNPVLLRCFSSMYQKVMECLSAETHKPVALTLRFALPGFHIWLTEGICTAPVASVHFDLQYLHLNWDLPVRPDVSRVLSFTLPLKLPAAGGGLNVWDLDHQEYMEARQRGFVDSIDEMKRFKTMTLVRYEVGKLTLHSGHILHQIAPTPRLREHDERITLQGHGALLDDAWHLYW